MKKTIYFDGGASHSGGDTANKAVADDAPATEEGKTPEAKEVVPRGTETETETDQQKTNSESAE